jgi:outer membrane receptor protein involved in Fe transport
MRKIILLLFQLCFFSTLLFAQSGKITGTVTDSKTGEALIGVNVVVEGSVLGAATDLEGYYVILNVPPGKKTLKISYIGYTSQSVTNVSVNIDQTTVINVALSSQSIETQEVVVTAAVIPIVQQDVSASRANITAEEIANLPTVSVDRVISTQAGVKSTDGGFEVRGGNARETAFVVNGITLRDERDNNPYTAISVTSIENLQVTTGGFSAEYGDLRSGIINVVTKEGRRDKYTYRTSEAGQSKTFRNITTRL